MVKISSNSIMRLINDIKMWHKTMNNNKNKQNNSKNKNQFLIFIINNKYLINKTPKLTVCE